MTKETYSIRLLDDDAEDIKKLGDGSLSKGIMKLWDTYKGEIDSELSLEQKIIDVEKVLKSLNDNVWDFQEGDPFEKEREDLEILKNQLLKAKKAQIKKDIKLLIKREA